MKQEQLNKIQKCLELSKSSNPHEAANALRMATKLMSKYGLSDDDINFVSLGKTMTNETIPKSEDKYITYLMTSIGNIYGVATFTHSGFYPEKAKRRASYVLYVGEKAPASLAAYTFDVVYRLMKKARRDYASTLGEYPPSIRKKMTKVFANHWIATVVDSIDIEAISEEKEKLYTKYLEEMNKSKVGEGKKFRNSRSKGYSLEERLAGRAGQEAAADVNIMTPMDGTETAKLSHEAA